MMNEYKSFFSLFNYPKKKVLLIFKTLKSKEQKLLIKKYDEDFSNTDIVFDLTESENKAINERIIRKMRLRLKKLEEGMLLVSIYDIFPNDKLGDIKKSMKETNLLSYFQNLFGEKLNGLCLTYKEGQSSINRDNIERVKRELNKNKGIHRIKIIKPFTSLFLKYKKEEETYEEFENRLRNLVNNMSDKYKNVIYKLYNKDLNNVILKHPGTVETRKIFSEAYSIIIKKLDKDLQVNKSKKIRKYSSILTLFNYGTTLKEIREKLKLNDRIYMLSKKKYGEDLNTPSEVGTLTLKENQELYEFYHKVKESIFREKKLYCLIKAKNMLDSSIHKAFSEIYGYNLSYALVIYINFSDYLTMNEICHLSNIKLDELIETIENYEINFKKKLRLEKHNL